MLIDVGRNGVCAFLFLHIVVDSMLINVKLASLNVKTRDFCIDFFSKFTSSICVGLVSF
jgi:hypothetical protein